LTFCLRELRNLEDNKDFLYVRDDDNTRDILLVNVKKHLMITEIVNLLFQYQKIDFEKREPIYSFLLNPSILSEDDLELRFQEIDIEV